METEEKEEKMKSRIARLYQFVRPHISIVNDIAVFAKFINTSLSILILLDSSSLVSCKDVSVSSGTVQLSAKAMEATCEPFTPSNFVYDLYLYTFLFNIGLFIFNIYLSRRQPWKQHSELVSVIVATFTLIMLFSKLLMIFYVPSLDVYYRCDTSAKNYTIPYCTDKTFIVNITSYPYTYPVTCSGYCDIHPNIEIYFLASTLILSFFYICYLVYSYHVACLQSLASGRVAAEIVSIFEGGKTNVTNHDVNVGMSHQRTGLLSGKKEG